MKPKIDLIKIDNKYFNGIDLKSKDQLNKNRELYFSLDPRDSYKIVKQNSPVNNEPPLPYLYRNFNDSIVFKKIGNLTKMYIRDNNTGFIKSPEYYYDEDFRIVKITETINDIKVTYK